MRGNGNWHMHAERDDTKPTDIPDCSEHEAQFWTRNPVRAHANVTVTEPDGMIRRFSGTE